MRNVYLNMPHKRHYHEKKAGFNIDVKPSILDICGSSSYPLDPIKFT